ncbi:MAG: hypothetical protein HC893_11490 [Chloroflexaceae bacterium]|nr:hypothetical protein [Chloroflexaceae bacterium]
MSALEPILETLNGNGGQGFHLLTEAVSSPTFESQITQLQEQFPNMVWHQYEPLGRSNAYNGAVQAFGQPVVPVYNFTAAEVVLSLDDNFLFSGPGWIANARAFASRRRIWEGELNRLYVVEGSPTTTGTMADHHLWVRPSAIEGIARAIAERLGLSVPQSDGLTLTEQQEAFVTTLVEDLQANLGASIVLAGEDQPPAVHVLAHAMNEQLGNLGTTVTYVESPLISPTDQMASLRTLTDAMEAGTVNTLLMVGANPVFTAPVDLDFGGKLANVQNVIHMGLYNDETGQLATWHLPEAHFLETWSDVRAFNGVVSIIQPLIAPLFNARNVHELFAVLLGQPRSAFNIVRDQWGVPSGDEEFSLFWQATLNDGVVADTAFEPVDVTASLDNLPDRSRC